MQEYSAIMAVNVQMKLSIHFKEKKEEKFNYAWW
jgi:hypothetical protein